MVQKSRSNLGARNEQFLDETFKLKRKEQVESRMILLPDEEDEGREGSLFFWKLQQRATSKKIVWHLKLWIRMTIIVHCDDNNNDGISGSMDHDTEVMVEMILYSALWLVR